MSISKLIDIRTNGEGDIGHLSFFEAMRDIPFEIKRVYYTYNVAVGVKRGMHAHKRLNQLLWCPYGTIEVILDDGTKRESYILNSPDKGLIIGNGIWREMYWKNEASVLCVVASDYYDESDYIRNYDEFLEYINEGKYADEDKF